MLNVMGFGPQAVNKSKKKNVKRKTFLIM